MLSIANYTKKKRKLNCFWVEVTVIVPYKLHDKLSYHMFGLMRICLQSYFERNSVGHRKNETLNPILFQNSIL